MYGFADHRSTLPEKCENINGFHIAYRSDFNAGIADPCLSLTTWGTKRNWNPQGKRFSSNGA